MEPDASRAGGSHGATLKLPLGGPLGWPNCSPQGSKLGQWPSIPGQKGWEFWAGSGRAHLPSLCQHACLASSTKSLPLLQRCFSPIRSTHPPRVSLPHRAACKSSCSKLQASCSPPNDAQSALSRIITAAVKDKRAGIGRDDLPFFHATEKQKEAKGRHSWLQAPNPTCSDSKTSPPFPPPPHGPQSQVAQMFNSSENEWGGLFLHLHPPERGGWGAGGISSC